MRKLLILGLDGLSPELLEELVGEGLMPNLASMLEEGVFSRLRSTVPPNSCPAWPCMATGKNPGKVGIFDLLHKDGYSMRPVSSRMMRAEPIWHILSRSGIRVGVMNVPGTYPPEHVGGFMVTGMLTPSSRECLYPRGLRRALRKSLDDYPIDLIPWGYFDDLKLIKDAISVSQKRAELAIRLLRLTRPSFLFLVFTTPDRLLHFLWRYIDPSFDDFWTPRGEEVREALKRYWRGLDALIGAIVEVFGPGLTFVVSDHGFGPRRATFFINEWLRENGLLRLRRGLKTHVITSLARLFSSIYALMGESGLIHMVYPAATKLFGFRKLWDYTFRYFSPDRSLRFVSWAATAAFSLSLIHI